MQQHDIPRQNPFSLYDIIGYFIPGSIFLFFFILSVAEEKLQVFIFLESYFKSSSVSFVSSFIVSLVFFSISYTLGQIISVLSNVIIEQSKFCNFHNYLYYILMKEENNKLIPKKEYNLFTIILFYIPIYETIFKMFGAEGLDYRKPLDKMRAYYIKKSLIDIFLSFYDDGKKEDNGNKKKELENKVINYDPKSPYDNYFELIYHYVIERTTNHLYKIQNYVALYGFMRNISMVFCLLFWLAFICTLLHLVGYIKLWHYSLNIFFVGFYSFLSYVTLIGVHKYKRRYTLEVLHAATALNCKWNEQVRHKEELAKIKSGIIKKK